MSDQTLFKRRNVVLIVLAVAIAIVRPLLPTHPVSPFGSYEATAHLFVGYLIGGLVETRRPLLLRLVIVLTIVEVVCAISSVL